MISLTIHLPPMAKARPRVTRRGTYMPKAYVEWKKRFGVMAHTKPWYSVGFECRIVTHFYTATGKCRCDLDNAHAACLDALQDARIIINDHLVKAGSYSIAKGPECIVIEIEPLANPDTPTAQIRKRASALEPKK